jgi:hypothetical protein
MSAPQICETLKARHIRYSAVKGARFVTHGEDGEDSLGPIVTWIAKHPNNTTAENVHDVSPDISSLLATFGVEGAVIEWYEGAVETLSGPPLLRATLNNNPTYYLRRFLTTALGMPITAKEREADELRGPPGSSTRTRLGTANLAPGYSALATAMCSARRPPSTTSSGVLAHLASSFVSPEAVVSSAVSTRSRPHRSPRI